MKKILLIIFIIIPFSLNANDQAKEGKVAKYVMENIQKEYLNCYSFYKVAAVSFKKAGKDKNIIDNLESSADVSLKYTYDLGEIMGFNPEVMSQITEDNVNIEVMRSVCLDGPGHYLGHSQTLDLMQTEYIYPALGDRTSPKEWAENERPDLLKKATALKKNLLSNPSKAGFPREVDDIIRKTFSIYLN